MPFAEVALLDNKLTIRVSTEWNEKELIKAIPGARYMQGSWWVPLTWPSCLQLRGTFKERLIIGEMLNIWAKKVRAEYVDPALHMRTLLEPDDTRTLEDFDRLYPFQNVAVNFMDIANSGILGDDMGCGKTIEMLSYLAYLEKTDNPYPAIIICPNSLKPHWYSRILEWVPNAEPFIVDGPARTKAETIDLAFNADNAIVIINYESVRSFSRLSAFGSIRLRRCRQCDPHGGEDIRASQCQAHKKALNDFGWRTVILDEAHRIKEPQSQQTRACWAICHEPTVRNAWALTGTPIEKSIEDLWSIMHAVRPDEYPTKSKFVDRYGITSWNAFGGTEVTGMHPDYVNEFRGFFYPRFRRMQKDIVLRQLPSKVYTTRYVEMSATQKRMYSELEDSLMCRGPDGKLIIAGSALGARTRLMQLACATCKISNIEDAESPSTWEIELTEPSSKLDELEIVVEELGDRKAVIAAEHSKLIDLAEKRLTAKGISCLKITGDVSVYDRQRALDALNNGYIQILLFTAKAGGVGLDMSAASCLIWLQHPQSLIDYLQAEDRVRRIGSEKHEHIDIIHIITRGTIEEDKLENLNTKLKTLDEITQDKLARIVAGVEEEDALLSIGADLW